MNDDPKSPTPRARLARRGRAGARRARTGPAPCLASFHPAWDRERADRHYPRESRFAVRRRRQRDPRPRLLVVDLHPRARASEDQCGACRAGEPVRACDVRGLHPPAGRRSRSSRCQASARRSQQSVLLRRWIDLGRGRAQDRLSILDQLRRAAAAHAGRLRRRLSRRHAGRHVARARLPDVQSVPRSDVQGRGAPLPRDLRRATMRRRSARPARCRPSKRCSRTGDIRSPRSSSSPCCKGPAACGCAVRASSSVSSRRRGKRASLSSSTRWRQASGGRGRCSPWSRRTWSPIWSACRRGLPPATCRSP